MSRGEATGGKGAVLVPVLCQYSGKALWPGLRALMSLAPRHMSADSNSKYQLSRSVHRESKKQAEGRGNLEERILLLYNFISMLTRSQM